MQNLTNAGVREKLRKYIQKYGTTKAHIAREVNVSRNTITQFSLGNRDVSIVILDKINRFMKEKLQ